MVKLYKCDLCNEVFYTLTMNMWHVCPMKTLESKFKDNHTQTSPMKEKTPNIFN